MVLGGDCSILLGCLLPLRRRGRFGLFFLDGHADFYQPEAEPNGEAASMDLALATGRGPAVVTDLERLRPLVRDEDVVAFGIRDAEDAAKFGSQRIEDSGIELLDLAAIRQVGTQAALQRALDWLTRPELLGFWVHLDADVLDDAVMPAVDYRMPDGLTFDGLATILGAATASGRMAGIDITIFNPALDPDGAIAAGFANAIARGLRSWARPGYAARMPLRLPPLPALRFFEAAGRHLSFKLAAAELNVTPSAVSHGIVGLERALGVDLFVREPRKLSLTPEGRTICPMSPRRCR